MSTWRAGPDPTWERVERPCPPWSSNEQRALSRFKRLRWHIFLIAGTNEGTLDELIEAIRTRETQPTELFDRIPESARPMAHASRRTEQHVPEAGLELVETRYVVDELIQLIEVKPQTRGDPLEANTMNKGEAHGRRRRSSEDVNEAPKTLENEPVDVETETPMEGNASVERLGPDEADAPEADG